MTGWKRWAAALLTLAAGAAAIGLALHSSEGLEAATRVAALMTGLTPLALGVVVWARRRPAVVSPAPRSEQTGEAQRRLAEQVLRQWRTEIVVRRLDDPGPLAVRWRFTGLDVADHAGHIARPDLLRSLLGRPGVRFSGRTDRIGEMAAQFRKLTRRRLVILGEPGMGKTTVAVLLLRELLDHAEPDEPTPVLLSMSGWDPGGESLPDWLARRLAEDYPALRAPAYGPDAPRSLVTSGRILPVLDGLDELPEATRARALVRLNEAATEPLILTCRTSQYLDAVTAPGGDVLTGGAVVEPVPLSPADVAGYLASCLPPRPGDGWPRLLSVLREPPGGPVRDGLSTPLALWLLRTVYIDTRTDPTELCDARRFPTAATIVEHLLDHLVGAVVGAGPAGGGDDGHPFRPRRSWEPADARRWLAFLAHQLSTVRTRDLAWWHLHRAAPRRVAAGTGLFAALVLGLAWGVHDGIFYGTASGVVDGSVLGPVFGLAVSVTAGLTVWHLLGLLFGLSVLAAGVSAGLVAGQPVVGLAFGTVGVVATAAVVLLAVKGVGFTPATGPSYADLRLRGRVRLLARSLTAGNPGRLVLRFAPGFTIGFAYGLVLGAAGAEPNGPLSGLVIGLVFGGTALLAIGLIDWAETPESGDRPQTPARTFRRDLQLVFVKSLTGGCAVGVAFWIVERLPPGHGLVLTALFVVAVTLGIGLNQSSGRFLVTVVVLRLRGQAPLRLLSFLSDAHRLGLLRQTGAVYQFRHAELQDRLARDHLTGPGRPGGRARSSDPRRSSRPGR